MLLAGVLLLAVLERAICWNQRPPDMGIFLEPWFNHLVRYGPIGAFGHPFSNYEPAYLYLMALASQAHGFFTPMAIIKCLSIAGTLFLASALGSLLKSVGVDRRYALVVLALPSVAINDALLAQCDALWVGCCIFALASTIRGRSISALVWCGAAVSFKLQSAFIAPVIVGALIGRRPPLWQWPIPALVFLASLVPAWLAGWSAVDLLGVYPHQGAVNQLAGRLANPWMIATYLGDEKPTHLFVIGFAAATAAGVAVAALAARNWRDPRVLLILGALSATALPFLLPKMLERYYFLADALTLALAVTITNRNARSAFLAIQLASILSHVTYIYFFYDPWPTLVGAVCAAAGIAAMCRLLVDNQVVSATRQTMLKPA